MFISPLRWLLKTPHPFATAPAPLSHHRTHSSPGLDAGLPSFRQTSGEEVRGASSQHDEFCSLSSVCVLQIINKTWPLRIHHKSLTVEGVARLPCTLLMPINPHLNASTAGFQTG